jgi:hypothetical protein
MPKTAVGLFENRGLVEGVVHDVEALGFPRREVRRLTEPADFNVTGVMSFPELNYEADLIRELTRIGATHGEGGLTPKACGTVARWFSPQGRTHR